MSEELQLQEVVDRCRRMETRLTKFLETQGFDTKVRRPLWRNGEVIVPSMATSLHDVLATIPAEWNKSNEVQVYCKSDFVMSVFLDH